MSKSSMSDKALFNAANVIRSYGFLDQSSMIDLLYRVVMTKKALSGKDDDCDTVYRTMQEVSATLPRFPGDADLFFTIYNALSPLDERDILSFINIANSSTSSLSYIVQPKHSVVIMSLAHKHALLFTYTCE